MSNVDKWLEHAQELQGLVYCGVWSNTTDKGSAVPARMSTFMVGVRRYGICRGETAWGLEV